MSPVRDICCSCFGVVLLSIWSPHRLCIRWHSLCATSWPRQFTYNITSSSHLVIGTILLLPTTSEETEARRDLIIGWGLIILTFSFGSRQTNLKVCTLPLFCATLRTGVTFMKNPSKFSVVSFLQCTWLAGSSVFPWGYSPHSVPLGRFGMIHCRTYSELLPSALFYTLRLLWLPSSLFITAHVDAQLLNVSRLLILQCSLSWHWLLPVWGKTYSLHMTDKD